MHKIASIIGAAALALTLQLGAATPSRANPMIIAAAIGFGLLGLGVGAAIGANYNRGYGGGYGGYGPGYRYGSSFGYGPGYRYGSSFGYSPAYYGGGGYNGDPGYSAAGGHANACAQTYRSYNARSNTYLGYDGVRHQCLL